MKNTDEIGKITAYIIREQNGENGDYGTAQSGAVVPVLFDGTLMEHPKVIKIGNEHFISIKTSPLTYFKVSFAEANEVIDGQIIKTLTETI